MKKRRIKKAMKKKRRMSSKRSPPNWRPLSKRRKMPSRRTPTRRTSPAVCRSTSPRAPSPGPFTNASSTFSSTARTSSTRWWRTAASHRRCPPAAAAPSCVAKFTPSYEDRKTEVRATRTIRSCGTLPMRRRWRSIRCTPS